MIDYGPREDTPADWDPETGETFAALEGQNDDPYTGIPTIGEQLAEHTPGEDQPVGARPWPTLAEEAYTGMVGQLVRQIEPHSEADPAAVLVTLLAAVGAVCGAENYMLAANDIHPARIWPLIIGKTSSGAKGTSWSVVRTILAEADDREFFASNQVSGLSSGEGLIDRVRDPSRDEDDNIRDPGVQDKRLLVIETEFAAVLAKLRRDGSTLGATLRDAWDGRPLAALNRRHNMLTATGTHIVVIAHITPRELLAKLAESDLAGGSFNRHLPVLSRRSKLLPDGANLPAEVLADTSKRVAEIIYHARWDRTDRQLHWTPQAGEHWRAEYARLSAPLPDGRLADATARAKPQVLRLALTYALCDQASTVEKAHLAAALAVWDYAVASARYLFHTQSSEETDKLLAFISGAGSIGRTKTEITREHFGGNRRAAQIDPALAALVEAGHVTETKIEGRGRPTYLYTITGKHETNEVTKEHP